MTNDLAFCLYGKFNWPPDPSNEDRATAIPGCVLVRFVADEISPPAYKTWLAWVPKDLLSDTIDGLPRPSSSDPNASLPGAGNDVWRLLSKEIISGLWLHMEPVRGEFVLRRQLGVRIGRRNAFPK